MVLNVDATEHEVGNSVNASFHVPDVCRVPPIGVAGIDVLKSTRPVSSHRTANAYELLYLRSGETTWKIECQRFNIVGGDLLLVPPGVRHRGEEDVLRPCTYLWMSVNPATEEPSPIFTNNELDRIASALQEAGIKTCRTVPVFTQLFDQLLEHLKNSDKEDVLIQFSIKALLAQLIVAATQSLTSCQGPSERPLVEAAREFMEDTIIQGHSISMKELAKRLDLSVNGFQRAFKAEAGQTPADYLARLRCASAQEKLATTTTPVTTIAMDLGFSSSQYMATCFKKYIGMTPSAYRKRHAD